MWKQQYNRAHSRKKCFEHLNNRGLQISSFVSDRHRGIAKWIRELCPNKMHFHDLWHISKSIKKQLLKAGNEKKRKDSFLDDWYKEPFVLECSFNKTGSWPADIIHVEIHDAAHIKSPFKSP